jgi:NAD(P)-dependent dehydrogenase (short-subunit alcohol dehydrogenase family)
MSKEQISASYLEETKAKHLGSIERTLRATVIGVDEGNIGWAIANKLELDYEAVRRYNKETYRDHAGYIGDDTLVLCNGSTHLDWIEKQPEHKILQVMNDCLYTSITETKHFVNDTIEAPGPKYIVYIGSMAYNHVLNGSAVYCAAKAGLAHFAKCLAWVLAPKNYNVFCVHPSNTEHTPMTEETIKGLMRYRNLDRQAAEAYWGASLPRANWLQRWDIAEVVSFLVRGHADYMSGSQIELAGGQR